MLHKHRWILQDAIKVNHSNPHTNVVTRQSTTLLYVCRRCPAVKTESIDGHWTIAQILGKPRETND